MSDNELFTLVSLVKKLPDNATILEIGAFFGRSTYFLEHAIGRRAMRHIVVDTFEPRCVGMSGESIRTCFETNLAAFLPRMEIWQMDSRGVAERLENGNVTLDLALIDGDHSYEMVKSDTQAVMKHLRPFGTLCFHDFMNPCGVMRLVGEYVEKGLIEPQWVATSMLVARRIA
jgi:predicted O-methyltransferase YrrM